MPTKESAAALMPGDRDRLSSATPSQLGGAVLDPRKLLHLVTVIEQGSLARAARKLSVSQPALSKSMDRLEAAVGRKLLLRGPGGIKPTALGELIYSHARSIRDEMSLAQSRLHQREGANARVVTIGTLPSLAGSVMPLAVSRWREKYPQVLLRVVERVQVELLMGLLRHEFDFIVGQTEFYDVFLDGLKQRVLFRDRLCVFARSGHRLFELANPSWADLAQFPWICPMVGGPQRTILEKLVAAEGAAPPRQLIECYSIDFTKSLVVASDHLALLPAHAVAGDVLKGTIKALDVADAALKRDIAVIFREGSALDKVCQDLITRIEAVGADCAGERQRPPAS